MEKDDRRIDRRIKFRDEIQYEKVFKDGAFGIPVCTKARNITQKGLGFYSEEPIELNSILRIKIFREAECGISYIGRVKWVQVGDQIMKYIIGVEIKDISDDSKNKLAKFLNRADLFKVIDELDLEKVVDLQLVADYPPILKRIGGMEIAKVEPFTADSLRAALFDCLDTEQYEQFLVEKEMNFVFGYNEKIRFRVNIHMQMGKVEGTFRLIPVETGIPSNLGLPVIVDKLMENKKGLILIAGRTGSGKTTTLASMVELINNKKENIIITIEDPVEYLHTNKKSIIKQREVGRDTVSFAKAAKNALRQNPDVLVIGEILDMETMEVAISASESGVLVISSIHGATSIQALDRVTSFFPADMQKHILSRLALMLKGVITQELLPRLDGKGLLVAAEVLIMSSAMKRLVKEGEWYQIPSIIETGKNLGMLSMEESIMKYYRDGLIDGEYIKEYVK